ncbi:hypothetical protein B0H13DRAFT_2394802 [Mycena leptocephala]|nr:hypothetical protein B0H13DRAFT_2394802 [Mycena leptocephala]
MDVKDLQDKNTSRTLNKTQSVGKGVTGKSVPPYETAQCSARTEFSVLASPRPFSCFSATLHLRTSICTTGALDVSHMPARFARPLTVRMTTQFPLHARCFPHARSMFPARPLAFPHAHSLFPACSRPLAFPLRARSLFPARPRSLHADKPENGTLVK